VTTFEELRAQADEALALAEGAERGARLFVVATRLAAIGGDEALGEARRLLEQAAADGSAHAALELGLMLTTGRGGPVETARGMAWIVSAAEADLASAKVLLGGSLLTHPTRAAEGIAWLRRAAAAQEWTAFWLLGMAHLGGFGVARDPAQARLLLQTAAHGGVAEAQLELARLFAAGVGGVRDAAVAMRWERSAAEAGHPAACMRVAERALAQPGGVALALPWLERAADGGIAAAAARLAELYLAGHELPYDPHAAERWMARAKELGWRWDPVS
jgi:TPR repeat protein